MWLNVQVVEGLALKFNSPKGHIFQFSVDISKLDPHVQIKTVSFACFHFFGGEACIFSGIERETQT